MNRVYRSLCKVVGQVLLMQSRLPHDKEDLIGRQSHSLRVIDDLQG